MQFLAWRTGPDTGLLSFLGEHARICGVLEYTALLGAEVRLRLELCSFDLYVVYSLQLSILHINMVDRTSSRPGSNISWKWHSIFLKIVPTFSSFKWQKSDIPLSCCQVFPDRPHGKAKITYPLVRRVCLGVFSDCCNKMCLEPSA